MAAILSIAERLDAARRDLLDLGLRNTLLNYRLTKSRGVQIAEARSAEVVQLLVADRRSLEFVPGENAQFELSPTEANANGTSTAVLITAHNDKNLQTRLLATYYAARTHVEERGVNILFLALGMLHWYEDDSSDRELRAPLLLIPVELERMSARDRFKVKYNDEDVEDNLSLATRLKADFGIKYPELGDIEESSVEDYLRRIAQCIDGKQRWRVEADEIALGFFSFAKFLMYRDLEAGTWCTKENPDASPILAALIRDTFRNEPSGMPDDAYLDKAIAPNQLSQVVDVDSSQALAILDVRAGRNLVIQGPPGTGKSQTITNLVADALGQGKKVLFVAEKMAALEVVKRRLNKVGLGDACLELHSHSANKKAVLGELQRTLRLGQPQANSLHWELEHYKRARDQLNAYCMAINTPIGQSGFTPRELMGELIAIERLRGDVPLPSRSSDSEWSKEVASRLVRWNKAKINDAAVLVANLQAHLGRMGIPSQHPFHATKLETLLPSDRQNIAERLRQAIKSCQVLQNAVGDLAGYMGIAAACTRVEAEVLGRAAKRALNAPHLKGVELRTGDWQVRRDQIAQLLQVGARHTEIHAGFDAKLISEAWDQALLPARQVLSTVGRKWWRWLSGDYRRARNFVAGLCTTELPRDVETQLGIVDAVMEAAHLRKILQELEPLGASLYGVQWQGLQSDWAVLERLAEWIVALYRDVGDGQLPPGIVEFLAGDPAMRPLEEKVRLVEAAIPVYDQALPAALSSLALENSMRKTIGQMDLQQQAVGFTAMLDRLGDLHDAITFNNLRIALSREELEWVLETAWDWPNTARFLVLFFRQTCFEAFLRLAYAAREPLRAFDGQAHESARNRFRDLDVVGLKATQLRLAKTHFETLPSPSGYGQLGILMREFEKRSRHLPIRKLVQQAGNAIQAIKPVFMMSPMSIAAFVPPGSAKFDLVIFDEASQVRPVDAFGAVLRGQQVVVVGDTKQLPPTSFFDTLIGEDDPEDDQESVTSDIESLLGLMAGQAAPQRMLRWHYRSRHQSLITISNERFYDNRLVVFPSVEPAHRGLGLVFHHLPNTIYDRGKSRTNQKEAEIVARAVMAHAKLAPHLTLGVAAFSLQQAEAILDQLEMLRRNDPSVEPFFASHPFEPFFVKNLESVQGDERDVIFISVGYGRNAEGYVAMTFGALTGQGGERRLNVLITRARQCCEVFTNLTHDDIDLTRTPSQGVAALKAFLKYAQTGVSDVPISDGREEDSPFEIEVAGALRAAGHDVVSQVGSGGFRIDLAIRDSERRGRFLLGIECDGATYHRSRSARDRDRLRQDVLENLGWQIYRVWSADWFNHPERELTKLLAAIGEAKLPQNNASPNRQATQDATTAPSVVPVIERSEPAERTESVDLRSPPYAVCNLMVTLNSVELHSIHPRKFADWIREVVKVECPIHVSDVARRIADAAGVRRIGNRIESAFAAGVREAVRSGQIEKRGEFLWIIGASQVTVRDRSIVPNAYRRLELVAPEEIGEAILMIVKASLGINLEDVPTAVCRLLGFGRTTEEMSETIISVSKKLAAARRLEIEEGHVRWPEQGVADDQSGLKLIKGKDR